MSTLNGIALVVFEKLSLESRSNADRPLHSHTMTGTYRLRNDFCCLFIGRCHKQERREGEVKGGGEERGAGVIVVFCCME